MQRLTSALTSNVTGYGSYEPKRILTFTDTSSGKSYGIDTKYLDQILNDLARHAKNYPPQFDTDQDKLRAVQDIKMLSGMLDILINGPSPNPEILWRAGFLNSMGHNLDIAGSAEKTSTIFKNLLAMSPSDPRGNYMYGTYLAGIGKPKDALPYLEKALFVGVADAAYTLGMTHLPDMQGSGNVRDLRQAASLSTTEGATLASALSQFSVATHSEQRSQLDALLTDWAATAGISDMATRHN